MNDPEACEAMAAVERWLPDKAAHTHSLGGGSVVVTLRGGGQVVAKRGVGPDATCAEAAGLDWLRESAALPVPAVHGFDDDWLVMDFVAPGAPSERAAREFGRGLAVLHSSGAPAFGAPPPAGPAEAWIGMARMRNEPAEDWPTFYARDRIEPYVRECVDRGLFSSRESAVFDTLCARLPDLAGDAEAPARLHGDAWSGNVHWARDGRAWLIDPAAHGGHRETDLAMLRLFGTPLLDHILDAYVESAADLGAPLAEGWSERVALHQLFPLLVHSMLFGGGYVRQSVEAARAALR